MRISLPLVAGGALVVCAWIFASVGLPNAAAETAVKLPAPAFDMSADPQATRATAVFAGGCFWGVQTVFQHTRGVLDAVSGYAGGAKSTAHYEMVSTGTTGHAESVQVTYDPRQISYGQLLQVFFSVAHDPTTLDRQGPDSGTQYRSDIFYENASQKEVAERYIAQLDAAKAFPHKIVTQLTALAPPLAFYPAEGYHQDYATRHPESPYIATFDLPKVAHLQTMLPQLYRDKPVLVSQVGG